MHSREVKNGVSWLGAVDWDRRLFDSLIPLPDGTSYNAYLIQGSQKTAVLDTVDPAMAEAAAGEIADALALPAPYDAMLRYAAAGHDDGKARPRWQDAMGAPKDGRPYAKTGGVGGGRGLAGFRHEFASLGEIEGDGRFDALPASVRDLALHLVAAHHGHARPTIPPLDDAVPPEAGRTRAQAAALRFARLQAEWGPWGLAWWEALLRAADQCASRRHDAKEA